MDKRVVKSAFIRLGEKSINIPEVSVIKTSIDGRMILVIDEKGNQYETSVNNALIITKELEVRGDDTL